MPNRKCSDCAKALEQAAAILARERSIPVGRMPTLDEAERADLAQAEALIRGVARRVRP